MQSIITTQFTPDELTQIIRLAVSEALTAFTPYPTQPPTEPRYLSRKETAAQLGVTLTTLWERTRTGEITAHKFGHRVLYKPADVEAALSKVKVIHS
ncbi:helix-turn-helix domain-containing protein [Persicitalea sp.]|uniref:helix-turn-helix domain-containing protein n=1 Tax=Persicitalea sp. TaxID=3100273 RepID=UPI0035934639